MDNRKDLDQVTQDRLNGILEKTPDALLLEEVGFLRARKTYLTPAETKKFIYYLAEEKEVEQKPKPKRKTKKK